MLYDRNLNLPAYEEGRLACRLNKGKPQGVKHPYRRGQIEFYAWNVGWNDMFMDGDFP